jgi:hypothetical protein
MIEKIDAGLNRERNLYLVIIKLNEVIDKVNELEAEIW